MSHRRYSDQEFALILKKAAELQTRPRPGGGGGTAGTGPEGFSLEDIKSIAAEVGIDGALVERAATLLTPEPQPSTLMSRIGGGPAREHLEYSVPRRLSEWEEAELLDVARRVTGQQGKVDASGPGLSWSSMGDTSQIHVLAAPSRTGTEVRVLSDRTGTGALLTIFPLMGGLLIAAGVGASVEPASALVGAGILASGAGAGLVTARALWGRSTKRMRRQLREIMGGIASSLDSGTPPGDESGGGGEDVPGLPSEPPSGTAVPEQIPPTLPEKP